MKIAIMGAGTVGESLARALLKAGHEVMLSSRTPESEKMQSLKADLGARASIGTVPQTLAYSDIIAIAMNWDVIPEMVLAAGDWTGKIVLDMTQGAAETMLQLTGGRVVKIFNTIGAEHYQNPDFAGQAATMFYCGDDAEAKRIAAQLASDIGFDAIDAGGLAANKHLVNLAQFWVYLMRSGQGREMAFKLLKK